MKEMELYMSLAIAIYEACRQEAADSGRPVVPEAWPNRDEGFRDQFVATIERICQPGYTTSPKAEHESWMKGYEEMGWRYGEARDPEKKTHPDMVPFADLPESERQKDAIFLACCSVGRTVVSRLEDAEETIRALCEILDYFYVDTIHHGGLLCECDRCKKAQAAVRKMNAYRQKYWRSVKNS